MLRHVIRLRNDCTICQSNHEVGAVVWLVSVVTRSKVMQQHRSGYRRVGFAETDLFEGI